jgi:hypothetical protein
MNKSHQMIGTLCTMMLVMLLSSWPEMIAGQTTGPICAALASSNACGAEAGCVFANNKCAEAVPYAFDCIVGKPLGTFDVNAFVRDCANVIQFALDRFREINVQVVNGKVKISFELKVAVEFESTDEFSRLEVSASLKASYNLELVTFKKKPGCCIPHTPVPLPPSTPKPTTPVPTTPVPTTPVPTTPVPTTPVPTTPVPTTPVPTTTTTTVAPTTTTAAPTTPRPTFGQVTETPRTPLPSPTCPTCNNVCVQSTLSHVSQVCGMTLVNVNFQELGLVEFQSFCTSCLQTVLVTQTDSSCNQYTRLQTQLQQSCDICLVKRSPGDCGRESLCQWSPSLNRCCLADHVVNENEATPTSTNLPAPITHTPTPTIISTPAPSSDCYTRNVRAASTICGRDLLALDFAAMNYSDFRGMCASCLEAILFTQDGPCRKYDELQATLHVECDVCLGKRSADICERDARCYWNEHLNRCAINRPGTTAPSRDQCYNENLQVAADECGHPLVTTNFQNLAPGEFQSICNACLDIVISTNTVSGCASYTSLQQSLQIECHECNALRSQDDCDGNIKCAWMPQSQRCGVFRREDLARETDASQCSSNNDVCSAAGGSMMTATRITTTAMMMTTSFLMYVFIVLTITFVSTL